MAMVLLALAIVLIAFGGGIVWATIGGTGAFATAGRGPIGSAQDVAVSVPTIAARAERVTEAVGTTVVDKVDGAADRARDTAARKIDEAADSLGRVAVRIDPSGAEPSSTPLATATPAVFSTPTPPTVPTLGPLLFVTPAAMATATAFPASTAPVPTPAATLTVAARARPAETPAPTEGRAPRVLEPRPAPGSRVAAGSLTVEARGRSDLPVVQIRLIVDGAPLAATLERQGSDVWRAQAAARLAPGPHVASAVIVDNLGRTGSYRWQFMVGAP